MAKAMFDSVIGLVLSKILVLVAITTVFTTFTNMVRGLLNFISATAGLPLYPN